MRKNSKNKSSRKVLKGTKKSTKTVKGNKSVKGNQPVKGNKPVKDNQPVKGNKSVKGNKPAKGNKSVKKKKSKKKTINLELQPEVGGQGRKQGRKQGRHSASRFSHSIGPSMDSLRSKRTSRKSIQYLQSLKVREAKRKLPVNRVDIIFGLSVPLLIRCIMFNSCLNCSILFGSSNFFSAHSTTGVSEVKLTL